MLRAQVHKMRVRTPTITQIGERDACEVTLKRDASCLRDSPGRLRFLNR